MRITQIKPIRATIVALGILLITAVGIVAINANKIHLQTYKPAANLWGIQDSTKTSSSYVSDTIPRKAVYAPVSGGDYDEMFTTMIKFPPSVTSECMNVNIRVEVKNDIVTISNPITGDLIIAGVAVMVSPNHMVLICKMMTHDGTPAFFTLTRIVPSDADYTNPSNHCLIFHTGDQNEPALVLTPKRTCQELKTLLGMP